MNTRPRAVVGHVFGWLLVVCFVVLLTVIFNFLGTIICAALAGMMMGSARISRFHSLLVSLIFPAVISSVLTVWHAQLRTNQIVVLAVLCFALFWAIYLVMRALTAPAANVHANSAMLPPCAKATKKTRQTTVPVSRPLVTLDVLKGTWVSNGSAHRGAEIPKKLEIGDQSLVLTVLDTTGRVQWEASARLQFGAPSAGNMSSVVLLNAGSAEFSI